MDIASNRTLYGIFAAFAGQQPEREWLIYERADSTVFRWTYGEFLESIHRAANLLIDLGIGEGDVFNLHLNNHPVYPQMMLAASYLGATIMPTNPVSAPDEWAYLVEHSESKAVFTQADCLDTLRPIAKDTGVERVIVCDTGETEDSYPIYEDVVAKKPTSPPPFVGGPEKVAALMYTSGTTSRPKGVMLTNSNLIYGAEVLRGASGLRSEDRHIIALPLFHAAAVCHALLPSIIAGASIAIISKFSASRFFRQAVDYKATMAALFGTPLRMLLNSPSHPTDDAHQLRNVTFAQNLTSEQYVEWHLRFKVPLQQLWGMTETAGLPLMSPLTGARNLSAMGRPVVGYEVKLVNDDEREVPPGEIGQIIVRGEPGRNVMKGYLKNPEATSQTLRTLDDGSVWLFTGDTAYADKDGFVYFVDRHKDLIKRAGENISSTQIEMVIMGCLGVLDVAVVSEPDEIRDESVVAVVVKNEGGTLSADAIIQHCAAHLSPFKVPDRVVFVDSLPRTSVGKIQKNLVRDEILNQ